jgi:pilus assembly protein CpaB
MRFGTILVLLIAILAGAVAVLSARSIIARRTTAPIGTMIVVAAQPLAYGAELANDNVVEIPWSTNVLPDGAFKSKDELFKDGKRIALSRFESNEPILTSRVTGPGQRASLSTLIDPGMRAVTIRVDDVRGVAGFVMPSDRVDVVLSRLDGDNKSNSYADVLLQNVKVLAVDQLSNEGQDKPAVAKAVTVEVSTEQAQKLVLAAGVGNLSLVLRQAGGASAEVARRVGMVDLNSAEYVNAEKKVPEAARPVEEPAKPVVTRSSSSSITVIRKAKPQDYSVYSEE